MDWTPDQASAIDAITRWFKSGKSLRFVMAGYGGTGKTTLARYIAETLGVKVGFATYTGKAASVLREKGCVNVSTIHSLIYKPKGSSAGSEITDLHRFIREEERRPEGDRRKTLIDGWKARLSELMKEDRALFEVKADPEIKFLDLLIIDEYSMVGEKLGKDIDSFGKPILWMGDPGQLPPVIGKPYIKQKPDYTLSQIHRQAKESPIIYLADKVRRGEPLKIEDLGDVQILPKSKFDWDLVKSVDQVICGKNATRHSVNKKLRSMEGRTNIYPVKNDKLICLSNNHDKGLLNGVTCLAAGESKKFGRDALCLQINYDNYVNEYIIDPGHFEESYGERKSFPRSDEIDQFGYGYCITGHKSQGSQWGSIAVCDDKMQASNESFRRQWLYTVITRAVKNLTIYT